MRQKVVAFLLWCGKLLQTLNKQPRNFYASVAGRELWFFYIISGQKWNIK